MALFALRRPDGLLLVPGGPQVWSLGVEFGEHVWTHPGTSSPSSPSIARQGSWEQTCLVACSIGFV